MSEEKQKKRGSGKALGTLLNILIGALCGILIARYMQASGHYKAGSLREAAVFALMMLGFFAAILSQIILHEAGHLVFGLASGYRFVSFRVLSLMWLREGSRIKVKRLSLAGTGGQCLMEPPEMTDGRMPFKLYNLGGAIMNAASGVLFLLIGLLCPNRGLAQTLFWMLTANGLVMAFMNGVPLKLGLVNNDGVNTRELSRDPGALRAFWIQMKANALQSRGMRLKDMPVDWFYMPKDAELTNGMSATIAVFYEARLLDEHSFAEAAKCIRHILDAKTGLSPLSLGMLKNDLIYVLLLGEGAREEVEALLSKQQVQMMKAMKQSPSVLRTQIALCLLSEGDEERALQWNRAFDKLAGGYPYESDIASERELIQIAWQKWNEEKRCLND